jgi:Subtilase family/Secretion system C-terminal sorting domain/Beta-propeller repeat
MVSKNQLTFVLSFLCYLSLTGQTLVNKEWELLDSLPAVVDWSASTIDAYGNLIETGNVLHPDEGANIVTTKKNDGGEVVWKVEYEGGYNSNDYGIAITTDSYGNIYVAGTSYVPSDEAYNYTILKYNTYGSLQWDYSYDGPSHENDLPVAILVDGSGNVYVTGVSEYELADYLTLKIASNGSLGWQKRYDYNDLPDVPAGLEFDGSGNIVVAGASANSITDWDIATIKYSPASTQLSIVRDSSMGFDQPRAFTKGEDGNFYVTGQVTIEESNPDILTLKLDTGLAIVWREVYDGSGLEDAANAIDTDAQGNVYVTGFTKNGDSSKDILTIKYDSDGAKVWANVLKSPDPQGKARGNKITVDTFGNVFITGEMEIKGSQDIIVLQYDTDGSLEWHETYANTDESLEKATGILLDSEGKIYVTGKTLGTLDTSNVTLKYSIYKRQPEVVFDTLNNPLYWANQLIVGFDPGVVKEESVDNTGLIFGPASLFLEASTVSDISRKLDDPLDRITFVKIFKTLTTTCTEVTNRLGETVKIPPFWASFVLDFPLGTDLIGVRDSLRTMFPTVRYTHLNFAGELSTNDPLFDDQASLHSTIEYPEAHINVEPAWGITTGEEAIRVGVFDTGVEWRHEDFLFANQNLSSSVVKDGWDFQFNVNMIQESLMDPNYLPDPSQGGHGTKVSGIIGAVSNNGKGIAGIAGGNKAENHKGVSLYGLRVTGPASAWNNFADLSYLADAIMTSVLTNPPCDTTYAYGLHIQNHSYGFSPQAIGGPQENIDLLKDPVHFASRNQVIVVAAAGNGPWPDPDTPDFPGAFNDDWVMNIGGSGTGLVWHPQAVIGNHIDVVAPYPAAVTWTTHNKYLTEKYEQFGGTSSSSPHVAGVAALMLSYHQDLSRDDVEQIIQLTADDVIILPAMVGPDYHTGYGRVNACRALNALETNTIEHFDTDSSATTFFSDSIETILFELTDDYENDEGGVFAPGTYEAIVYKITANVKHDLSPGDTIIGWKRVSSSNLFGRYEGPGGSSGNSLDPVEDLELISYNQDSAVLDAYVYHLSDPGSNPLGWIPFPVDSIDSKAKLAYTLLTGPGVGGAGDECYTLTQASERPLKEKTFAVFPNPARNEVNIVVQLQGGVTNLAIDLFDANGRHVKTIYKGNHAGETLWLKDSLADLPAGLYFYRATTDKSVVAQKVIKQ